MAATGKHSKGRAVVVDLARAGTLDQFVAKSRGAVAPRGPLKTTWECLNCGNGLVSTRGISRCPQCGSSEIVKTVEPVAQHYVTPVVRETLVDLDTDPDPEQDV